MAYVINKAGKPLMPCSNAVARLLLRDNKARVKPITPKMSSMLRISARKQCIITEQIRAFTPTIEIAGFSA